MELDNPIVGMAAEALDTRAEKKNFNQYPT